MAYTSIIPVHRLDNSVDYVLDEKKTSRSQMLTPYKEIKHN